MRKMATCIFALSLCTGVAACSGGDGAGAGEDPLIGPSRSYSAALEISDTLMARVSQIAYDEGATRLSEMPASGTAQYRGVIAGSAESGYPVDYVGNLAIEIEFDGRDVSGQVSNFAMDGLLGLVRPRGEIDLRGSLELNSRTQQELVLFEGSGPLQWPGQRATVTIVGGGNFVGDEAQAISGSHGTEFKWTEGFVAEGASQTYGTFSAMRTE